MITTADKKWAYTTGRRHADTFSWVEDGTAKFSGLCARRGVSMADVINDYEDGWAGHRFGCVADRCDCL